MSTPLSAGFEEEIARLVRGLSDDALERIADADDETLERVLREELGFVIAEEP